MNDSNEVTDRPTKLPSSAYTRDDFLSKREADAERIAKLESGNEPDLEADIATADPAHATDTIISTTEELLRVNPEACVSQWLLIRASQAAQKEAIETAKKRLSGATLSLKTTVKRLGSLVNREHQRRFVIVDNKLVCIQYRKDKPAYIYIAEDNIGTGPDTQDNS
jgi:hypothetical protein